MGQMQEHLITGLKTNSPLWVVNKTKTMIQGKLLWAGILLGIELLVHPSLSLLSVLFTVIGLDFITGIAKAKMNKVQRTSEGYRKTIIKLMQYMIPILLLYVAGKWIPEYKFRLQQASGFVMMFIIYIEVTSICENLFEIDKKSPFSKYLIKPLLTILKFGIENNPITKAADQVEEQKKEKKDV